jgi:hypothetical protein
MHFVLEAIEKLSIDFSAKFDPWSRLFGHQAGWKPVLNFAKLKS